MSGVLYYRGHDVDVYERVLLMSNPKWRSPTGRWSPLSILPRHRVIGFNFAGAYVFFSFNNAFIHIHRGTIDLIIDGLTMRQREVWSNIIRKMISIFLTVSGIRTRRPETRENPERTTLECTNQGRVMGGREQLPWDLSILQGADF